MSHPDSIVTRLPGTAAARPPDVHAGWYLLGLADEFRDPVTPVDIGGRRLMAVNRDGELGVYDATCPHRGAHLGHGGTLARAGVACPFHGKVIHLGERADKRWCVGGYPVVRVGDAVFARLTDDADPDRGFESAMADLARTRVVVAGFATDIAVRPDLVVENAFDIDHFTALHGVPKVMQMSVGPGPDGEVGMRGVFVSRPPRWVNGDAVDGRASRPGTVRTPFHARAYSPTLVTSVIGPDDGDVIITGTVPTATGCTARVVYALTPDGTDGSVSPARLEALLTNSKLAFEQDRTVWEHMDAEAVPRFDQRDESLSAFRSFADSFPAAGGASTGR